MIPESEGNILEIKRLKHFVLHYQLRSEFASSGAPTTTEPIRFHGIYTVEHINKFESALERSWQFYTDSKWKFKKKKIDVYFRYLPGVEGRTWLDPLRIEFTTRHEDSCGPCNISRVQAAAAHELFHVLQAQLRPQSFLDSDPWAWFSEATAMFMENEVFPLNREYLCPLYRWFEEPDISLDQRPNGFREYGSLIFCKFLRDRFPKVNLIQQVWRSARKFPSPLHAIEYFIQKDTGTSLPLASSANTDLFASKFIVWNFFLNKLNGHPSSYKESKLYQQRFQHAFAEPMLKAVPGTSTAVKYPELGPLAARYHIIQIVDNSKPFRIDLELVAPDCKDSPGKGIVCLVSKKKKPIAKPMELSVRRDDKKRYFSGRFNGGGLRFGHKPYYALLIVANTNWKEPTRSFIENYRITVRC